MAQILLLDTHAFAWAVRDPGRLATSARRAIEDEANPLLVSAASAWEMAIKFHSGKWPEVEPIAANLPRALRDIGARIWPVGGPHGIRAGTMSWSHTDPFDRMLAAQALTDQLTLVTKDREFREVPGLNVLW